MYFVLALAEFINGESGYYNHFVYVDARRYIALKGFVQNTRLERNGHGSCKLALNKTRCSRNRRWLPILVKALVGKPNPQSFPLSSPYDNRKIE